MRSTLRARWAALVVALIVALASGWGVVARSIALVDARPCRGKLTIVPGEGAGVYWKPAGKSADLVVKWDDVRVPDDVNADAMYANVRVVWERADGLSGCSDVPLPWPRIAAKGERPSVLRVDEEVSGDRYVVSVARQRIVFRKVDTGVEERRFGSIDAVHVAAILMLLAALAAVAVAFVRALGLAPYTTRMHRWHDATLRADRLVEDERGGSVGVLPAGLDLPAGHVLVDPRALERREIYRALPVIASNMIVAGSHAEWEARARRGLDRAAMIAVVASSLAGVAYLLAR